MSALDQIHPTERLSSWCRFHRLDKEVAMPSLNWTDTLVLDFPPMDDMHRDFVQRLAEIEDCEDADLPRLWAELVEHTQTLFLREDTWMRNTRFSSAQNHTLQHKVVLNVMREGLTLARSGQCAELRHMAGELASWFAKHIQSLDAALALHMRRHQNESKKPLH
jgi:hemerythrin-like metal-binding protein